MLTWDTTQPFLVVPSYLPAGKYGELGPHEDEDGTVAARNTEWDPQLWCSSDEVGNPSSEGMTVGNSKRVVKHAAKKAEKVRQSFTLSCWDNPSVWDTLLWPNGGGGTGTA